MRATRLTVTGAALALLACLPPGAAPRAQGAAPGAAPAAPVPSTSAPAAAAPATQAAAADADPVVARVAGTPIHLSDLSAAAQALPADMRGMPANILYPMLLNQVIDRTALVLLARKQGLDKDPQVQVLLRRAEDQALQSALFSRDIGPLVSDAALRARYERDVAGKPGEEEVHARHILVASEDEAKKIIAELNKGADFAALAKQHSTDPGGAQGGDLGYFKKGDMVAEFADAAFALKPGEITQTPVKSQFGWHVIQVLDHRQGPPQTFEQAHDELRQAAIQEGMASLLKQAHAGLEVQKFNPDGTTPRATDAAEPPPEIGRAHV